MADLVHRQGDRDRHARRRRAALAAKAATTTIPIVFATGSRTSSQEGLVASLARPGGNVTGLTILSIERGSEAAGAAAEIAWCRMPETRIALVNPTNAAARTSLETWRPAAAKTDVEIDVLAPAASSISTRSCALPSGGRQPFVVLPGRVLLQSPRTDRRARGAPRPALHLSTCREYVEAGGLMSYGNDFSDAYATAGVYVGRILKGAKPADLPVVQAEQVRARRSTSRPPRRSASTFRRRCLPTPTR